MTINEFFKDSVRYKINSVIYQSRPNWGLFRFYPVDMSVCAIPKDLMLAELRESNENDL